jgi:hypothetical protein
MIRIMLILISILALTQASYICQGNANDSQAEDVSTPRHTSISIGCNLNSTVDNFRLSIRTNLTIQCPEITKVAQFVFLDAKCGTNRPLGNLTTMFGCSTSGDTPTLNLISVSSIIQTNSTDLANLTVIYTIGDITTSINLTLDSICPTPAPTTVEPTKTPSPTTVKPTKTPAPTTPLPTTPSPTTSSSVSSSVGTGTGSSNVPPFSSSTEVDGGRANNSPIHRK